MPRKAASGTIVATRIKDGGGNHVGDKVIVAGFEGVLYLVPIVGGFGVVQQDPSLEESTEYLYTSKKRGDCKSWAATAIKGETPTPVPEASPPQEPAALAAAPVIESPPVFPALHPQDALALAALLGVAAAAPMAGDPQVAPLLAAAEAWLEPSLPHLGLGHLIEAEEDSVLASEAQGPTVLPLPSAPYESGPEDDSDWEPCP